MVGIGNIVEAAAVIHAENAAYNSVTQLTSSIAKIAANNVRYFFHDPSVNKPLPVNLPLLGGGNVNLGVSDAASFAPKLFIDAGLPDIHLDGDSQELKLEHYSGIVDLKLQGGDYKIGKVSTTMDSDLYAMIKALARLDIKNDIDLSRLENPTPAQLAILKEFGVTLPPNL